MDFRFSPPRVWFLEARCKIIGDPGPESVPNRVRIRASQCLLVLDNNQLIVSSKVWLAFVR
ncbi:unnamed protein product [Periconia digitata]|uniref:Uncharacterized protein n=1 Tax=Periconia digitata TaxID=1303443 RepID=A0A9W4U4P0_9PLEO|nr:unnamed protein product [Periconia digitata]